MCVCVCVCACVRAGGRACVRAFVRACVRVYIHSMYMYVYAYTYYESDSCALVNIILCVTCDIPVNVQAVIYIAVVSKGKLGQLRRGGLYQR